jgi:hypothetical protein
VFSSSFAFFSGSVADIGKFISWLIHSQKLGTEFHLIVGLSHADFVTSLDVTTHVNFPAVN